MQVPGKENNGALKIDQLGVTHSTAVVVIHMYTRLALIVVKKYDIIYGGCNAVDSLQMLWSSIKPERGLIGAV